MFKKLDTTILRVSNINEAKKWYEEKLEFITLHYDKDEKLVVFDTGQNSSLTIWQIKSKEQLIPATAVSCYPIFSVDQAEEVRNKLQKRGVRTSDLFEENEVTYFHFFDPDGNMMEACQVHE